MRHPAHPKPLVSLGREHSARALAMGEDSGSFRWLGPLATPLAIALSLMALVVTFRSHAETLGWRTVSGICLGVSLGWSAWYLRSRVRPPGLLAGVEPRTVPRHTNRSWRLVALLLPVLTISLFAASFLWPRKPDYSALLEGGGPYSPMVVFDSEPRGAEVRLAWSLYGEYDPWLEGNNDKIHRLPGHTLTRARLSQGHYWVVFELDGQRRQKYVVLTGPTVVIVKF